MTKIKRLTV